MSFGIKKEKIFEVFKENGIVAGESISMEKLENAIEKIIEINNALIEKEVADVVAKRIIQEYKKAGGRMPFR